MTPDTRIMDVTERIRERSRDLRRAYLDRCARAADEGPARAHLACSNAAHAYAATGADKTALVGGKAPHLGIVTAYNDMLSAHQPFERFPDIIRQAAREAGATAQVAGGVPAMCDGVTQGRAGMELSLISRDVIAMAGAVAMSHDCFDAALWLGVCDKIVPGLVMAAASFGHVPAVFVPAGPMVSGLPNDEKARVRQAHASGQASRADLMAAEMASYHGPGTCTFYGTANTNQMLMEFMGLHLPGTSFVNPGDAMRDALTRAATARAAAITALGDDYRPTARILDERAFVNGMVGLMATGGSTNLILHLPAMARCAGIILEPADFDAIARAVPLMAKVYPNGLADVNHFHAAGGLAYLIGELIDAGLMHEDAETIAGPGLQRYTQEPRLQGDAVLWAEPESPRQSHNDKILRPVGNPFQPSGGLRLLAGNLGEGVIKTSSLSSERLLIEAPARVFESQEAVKEAFRAGELTGDCVVVVRFQGPQANGMPELHALTPILGVMQDRGQKVALVTDGRMSGASGKVPAAIHVTPEAAACGPLARLRDGDMIRLDAVNGTLETLTNELDARPPARPDLSANDAGCGRDLFARLRRRAGHADSGASILF